MSPTCAGCGRPVPMPAPTMPARFLRRDYPKFLDFVADVGTALDIPMASAADYIRALREGRIESDVEPREVALAWLVREAAAAPNTLPTERYFKQALDEIWRYEARHADECAS